MASYPQFYPQLTTLRHFLTILLHSKLVSKIGLKEAFYAEMLDFAGFFEISHTAKTCAIHSAFLLFKIRKFPTSKTLPKG